jgi:stage V sporulation protein G
MIATASVFKFKDQSQKAKAFVTFTIDEVLVIKGFKIIEGTNGLFLGVPQALNKSTGEYEDTCFPIEKEFREYLQGVAIEAFNAPPVHKAGNPAQVGKPASKKYGK